eukprot:4957375-Pyramimonas_sp.AAC.1
MGSEDHAALPMYRRRIGDASTVHRRCIANVGGASATSARSKSGSASSRVVYASAMRRNPPTPSTPPPS